MVPPPLLVTYHPVTLEYERAEWQMGQLLDAIEVFDMPVVLTLPNADTNNCSVRAMIERYVERNPTALLVENFGIKGYFSMMSQCAAMVGNSSSGIIEAPSFRLPVVNIGTRQEGRIRGRNVIDVGYSSRDIIEGISRAISEEFRESLKGMDNPYAKGNAAEIIVKTLEKINLDGTLAMKRFVDL